MFHTTPTNHNELEPTPVNSVAKKKTIQTLNKTLTLLLHKNKTEMFILEKKGRN